MISKNFLNVEIRAAGYTDSIYFLKKRLSEINLDIFKINVIIEDYGLYEYEPFMVELSELNQTKILILNQLKKEKKILNYQKKKFYEIINSYNLNIIDFNLDFYLKFSYNTSFFKRIFKIIKKKYFENLENKKIQKDGKCKTYYYNFKVLDEVSLGKMDLIFSDFKKDCEKKKNKKIKKLFNLDNFNKERFYNRYVAPIEIKNLVRDASLLEKIRCLICIFEQARKKNDINKFFKKQKKYNKYELNQKIIDVYNQVLKLREKDKREENRLVEFYNRMKEDQEQLVYDPDIGAPAGLSRIESQMEKESKEGECDLITNEQKENVVLTTHADESVAKPITLGLDNWEKLCSSQSYQAYDLMQRWQKYKTIVWTKDDLQGKSLLSVGLPSDFVSKFENSPSCILLKTYAYCRFDLEVKIQINSNKFHCGALQASFYYGSASDDKYYVRENVASASQMAHCIVDAAAASDGVLEIPYRYYKPLISTRLLWDDNTTLSLGNLRLLVLNPLRVPSGSTDGVDVSLFIRFVNPRLHGMIGRNLGTFVNDVEPQMFSVEGTKSLVRATESLLNNVFPDPERDNPTDPKPPNYVMPTNSSSWCIGDIIPEKTNPLRLQANGVTPHPPGTIPEESEMNLSYIQSIYGLVNTLEWSTSQLPGTILKVLPFSPILANSDYIRGPKVDNSSSKDEYTYCLPPIAVLSELFGYWRGSIDYRLDFISTQFHTGRLIVAYIPRIGKIERPTIDDLTACDHFILDLRDGKQYQFINRFLSDKPWWPRRRIDSNSTETYPPGYIYIAVLNRLSATQNVDPKVEINLYMRGASDFELHIPVTPHIGLAYNTKIINRNTSAATYVTNYGPPQETIYVGSWHSLNPTGKLAAVFRYGPTSDHVTQFIPPKNYHANLNYRRVYKLVGNANDITFYDGNGAKVAANYLVIIPPSTDLGNYYYGAAFNSKNVANSFAKTIKKQASELYSYDINYLGIISKEGDYSERKDTVYWEAVEEIAEEIEAQMEDERKFVCGDQISIHPPVNSTWNGLLTFGEQITSVKQLIRRYQLYCSVDIPRTNSDFSLAKLKLPLIPQGLDLDLTQDYWNQSRDGLIPILLSGYRYFRGGMRLKIFPSNDLAGDRHMWITHKCDENLSRLNAETQLSPNNINNRMTAGYASYTQNLKTNSVISLEVPFYLPGQFGLLQRPNLDNKTDSVHYSLGNLYMGTDYIMGTNTKSAQLQIFYSLSDDFRATVFQGFPPVFKILRFLEVEAQADTKEEEKKGSWFSSWPSISTYMTNKVTDTAKNHLQSKITTLTKDISEDKSLTEIMEHLTADIDAGKKTMILCGLSNIVHAIVSPTWSTIAWSIVSFFVTIGALTYSVVNQAYQYLVSIIQKIFPSKKPTTTPNKTNPGVEVEAQADEDAPAEAAFISTIVVSVLAFMGAKDKPIPKDLPNFSKYLYEGIPRFTLCSNGLYLFFKNNLKMLKSIYNWCFNYLFPETAIQKELDQSNTEIHGYVRNIQWCLDARNETQVQTDVTAQLQVYMCANVAQVLLAKIATSKVTKPMPVFNKMLYQIIALRDKLSREFASPPARYEPFVFGLVGPSKIGKSHMVNRLISDIIQSIGYKSHEELIYVRTPGNAYWNNLRNQVACVFDDFLCLQDPVFGMQQVGELFALKSTSVFNPPKAAIEEKNIRYNPLIVALCSNVAFPKITGVADEKAFWRRRDILVHVQAKQQYLGKDPRTLAKDVRQDYGHLEFRVYEDSTQEGFVRDVDNKELIMSYSQFNSYLIRKHQLYYEHEVEEYQIRLENLEKHTPIDTNLSLKENIEKMDEYIKRIYPNDVDKLAISTKNKMGGNLNQVVNLLNREKEKFRQKVNEVYTAPAIEDKDEKIQRLESELAKLSASKVESQMNEPKLEKAEIISNPSLEDKVCLNEAMGSEIFVLSDEEKKEFGQNKKPRLTTMIEEYFPDILWAYRYFEELWRKVGNSKFNSLHQALFSLVKEETLKKKKKKNSAKILTFIYKECLVYESHYTVPEEGQELLAEVKSKFLSKEWEEFQPIKVKEYKVKLSSAGCMGKSFCFEELMLGNKGYTFDEHIWKELKNVVPDCSISMENFLQNSACHCFKHLNGIVCYGENTIWFTCESDTYTYGSCGKGCVFTEKVIPQHLKKLYICLMSLQFRFYDLKIDRTPTKVLELLGIQKKPETVSDVLERANAEIEAQKNWFQKYILDKMPNYSQIMTFLLRLGGAFLAIWSLIKAGNYLFNVGTTIETENNWTNAEHEISEAVYTDCKYVNATVSRLWTENTEAMENSVIKLFTNEKNGQMPASGSSATVGKPKGNSAPVKAFIEKQSQAEIHNVMVNKIRRNTFWINVEFEDDRGIVRDVNMRCLGIAGRYFINIDHYDTYILNKIANNTAKTYFVAANCRVEFDYKLIEKKYMSKSALVLCKLPVKFTAFQNIIKFIMPAKQHSNIPVNAMLIETVYDTRNNNTTTNLHHFTRITANDNLSINNDDGTRTVVNKVYTYPKSQRGVCGSVLVSGGNFSAPIIGIHIAGIRDGISGYAEAIAAETFNWLVSEICASGAIEAQYCKDEPKMLPDTNVKFDGVVTREYSVRPPEKTRLVKTECYNQITTSTMEPSILSYKDDRIKNNQFSPLFEGIRNHGMPPIEFPQRELDMAAIDLEEQLLSVVLPQRMKIGKLSEKEAIVGIEGSDLYQALDFKTSEGFPLVKFRPRGATSKEWLFDLDETVSGYRLKGIDPKLRTILNNNNNLRNQNLIPDTIFTACLKDCKIDKEKVLKPGKTRIFSISPIDFTIQQRQYFMDFSVAYQEARFSAEHAIGIDIKSTEVKELINTLLNNSEYLITGDYSKYGDQLQAACVEKVYKIICAWYKHYGDISPKHEQVRMIFCEEVMHAKILAINTVYQCFCGMPSGNPLTVIINSMVNSLYTRIVWQLIMKEKNSKYYSLKYFHLFTKRIFYGDDLFMSVAKEVIDLYNTKTLSEKFAEFNIKFTDSNKGEEIKPFCKITDVEASFLKHTFYPHPMRYGEWIAKLDNNAAHETCNWTWNTNNDLRASSIEACVAMMEEIYGHGESHYNQLRSKIIKFWQNKNVLVKIPFWYEMDIRIFN